MTGALLVQDAAREPDADDSGGPRGAAPPADASRLLGELFPLLSAQRAAILARDAPALSRATEALSQHLPTLEQLAATGEHLRQRHGPDAWHAFLASARCAWEQIRLNQLLIALGSEASHHFALLVAGSIPAGDPALFSGLG